MNQPVSQKNQREVAVDRDFPESTPIARRYAILSSPRSGSTLLGRMLRATGAAGDPLEYLNPRLLKAERQRTGDETLDLNGLLRIMGKRRTSPNGVFGIKIHYSQLLAAFRTRQPNDQVVAFLRANQRLIWIRRRDRLGQGISQAIAIKTQRWSSEEAGSDKPAPTVIHPLQCLAALQTVAAEDAGWEPLLKLSGLPFLEVWYEDLVADYENQSRRVLRYLDLDSEVTDIPPPPIERQAGALNDSLRAQMIGFLGLG